MYEIYMMCGGETGWPDVTKEFELKLDATSYEDAFKQWIKINKLDESKYIKVANNKWVNYYTVYVNKL